MRNAFASELTSLANDDERIVLMSGDIGNKLFDDFKSLHPRKFFNCGVAEGNMIGVAAGLATCGLRPVVYTIATFNSYRCLEQIRIDVCYHRLPVIIVGVGAGLSYAGLGATHQSLDDMTMFRMLPEMTVVCPGDAVEVRLAFREALKVDGPVYLRLGKKDEPVVHQVEPAFKIGKGIIVRKGEGVCLLSTGNMLSVAYEAAVKLGRKEYFPQVMSMHTVKPLDTELLVEIVNNFDLIVTLEEHNLSGGFGSSVAEWLVDSGVNRVKLCRIGVDDKFLHGCGSQENARSIAGLTAEMVTDKILMMLG